jgi:hypothetical protein
MLEHKHGGIYDFIVQPLQRLKAMDVLQLEVDVGRHTQGDQPWVQGAQDVVHVRLFVVREALQAQFVPAKESVD